MEYCQVVLIYPNDQGPVVSNLKLYAISNCRWSHVKAEPLELDPSVEKVPGANLETGLTMSSTMVLVL